MDGPLQPTSFYSDKSICEYQIRYYMIVHACREVRVTVSNADRIEFRCCTRTSNEQGANDRAPSTNDISQPNDIGHLSPTSVSASESSPCQCIVAFIRVSGMFQVMRYDVDHTCKPLVDSQRNRSCTSRFLSMWIAHHVAQHPGYNVDDFIRIAAMDANIGGLYQNITHCDVQRALNIAVPVPHIVFPQRPKRLVGYCDS